MDELYRLTDNTEYRESGGSDVLRLCKERPALFQELLDTDLGTLGETRSIFVFPPRPISKDGLAEGQRASLLLEGGLVKDQKVFSSLPGGGFRTGNVMGFIGSKDVQITIGSRFAPDTASDYLVQYMVERVFTPNIVDYPASINDRSGFLDLLMFAFPDYLLRAMRKGVYRTYVHRENNDACIRGPIDFARHLAENVPFEGCVAYSTTEIDEDNPATELIRHTIEYLDANPRKCGRLLARSREIREATALIRQATPRYMPQDKGRVIEENLRHPVRQRFYSEYLDLQRLCIGILTHRPMMFNDERESGRMYGILFDGAWLWEEYLNTLIGNSFVHPGNKTGQGRQFLFQERKRLSKDGLVKDPYVYPDFISRAGTPRIIADAKYKNREMISTDDFCQMLAYLCRFDSDLGLLLHPVAAGRKQTDDGLYEELHLLRGEVEFPGVEPSPDRNDGRAPAVEIIGFAIPGVERADDSKSYRQAMEAAETRFTEHISQAMETEEARFTAHIPHVPDDDRNPTGIRR